jgi:hypothetical protein
VCVPFLEIRHQQDPDLPLAVEHAALGVEGEALADDDLLVIFALRGKLGQLRNCPL